MSPSFRRRPAAAATQAGLLPTTSPRRPAKAAPCAAVAAALAPPRRRLLHPELAPVEILAVELRDGLVGLRDRGHLHEPEATRVAGVTIGDDGGRLDLAGLGKRLAELLGRCREGESADE